jgi:phosphoribosylaminoimidazolecarboxamide formyltransferase/IMP cyclohydrolase
MPRALISVWEKTGIVEFAHDLQKRGWDLIASGGTARVLVKAGLSVLPVSEITGESEMLSGRVKTLHPAIYAPLLSRDTETNLAELKAHGWDPIDLVAVNLYPFEKVVADSESSLESVIENIDIGGVALLRAAAKNYARVTVLCDPQDYQYAVDHHGEELFRLRMAKKAFARTSAYDAAIESFFSKKQGEEVPLRLAYYPSLELRYGENPHQEAAFYSSVPEGKPLGGDLLQGKALSYNNLLDLDAAWRAVIAFSEPAVVVVKHTSPCGIAVAPEANQAIAPAIASDPVSAFGSVIACNRTIDEGFVSAMGDLFVECIVAPGFSSSALEKFQQKQNLRLLQMPSTELEERVEFRSVLGGLLRQSMDFGDPSGLTEWRVVTHRQPSDAERAALQFAWVACQHVKSNAIVIARGEDQGAFSVGIGCGQPSRVDSVRIAGQKAGDRAVGAVLASDAFFPFPDGVEVAAALGVTAIVQPGGAMRDDAVIRTADAEGLVMIFTGVRHFRH